MSRGAGMHIWKENYDDPVNKRRKIEEVEEEAEEERMNDSKMHVFWQGGSI